MLTPSCKFDRLLDAHRQELLHAKHNFYPWKTLEGRDEEQARVLNAYRGFFRPAIDALRTQFVLNLMNLIGTDSRLPNVYRLLRLAETDSKLASSLNIGKIRSRLKGLKQTRDKLKNYRDRRIAHWETEVEPNAIPTVGEVESFLAELEPIFHEMNLARNPGHHWSMNYSEQGHLETLLTTLQELFDQRRANGHRTNSEDFENPTKISLLTAARLDHLN